MTSVVRFEEWQEPTGTTAATVDSSGNVSLSGDLSVSGSVTSTGNPQGLTLITPSSVTGGTLSGAKVVVSGVSTVNIQGIFTSDFENYLMNARIYDASTPCDIHFRWLNGSTDLSTNDYWWAYQGLTYSSASANTATGNSTYGYTGTVVNTGAAFTATIFSPYNSDRRSVMLSRSHSNTATDFRYRDGVSAHRNEESHDGIQLNVGGGSATWSGEIFVYGYGQ